MNAIEHSTMNHSEGQDKEPTHPRGVGELSVYREPLYEVSLNHVLMSEGAIVVLPLSFLALWAILTSIVSKIFSADEEEKAPPADTIAKSPCHKCQFFSDNPYLKCAIQPTLVFTAQSHNCPDYAAKQPDSKPVNREA